MKFSSCLVTEREAALTAGNIGIGVCHCGRPDRSACVLSPLLPNDKDGDDDQARRGQRSWRPRSPRFISTTTCPRRGSGSVNRQQLAVDAVDAVPAAPGWRQFAPAGIIVSCCQLVARNDQSRSLQWFDVRHARTSPERAVVWPSRSPRQGPRRREERRLDVWSDS